VSKRLARARETLRNKLVRRGVTVGSAGALTELLSAEAGAAVLPSTFVSATVQAASLAAAGNLAAGVGTGVVSANVAALTKGACNMLFWSSVKTAAVATAAAAVVAGSSAIVAQEVAAQRKAARPPVAAEAQAPGKDASASTNAAAIGDDAMAMCLRAQQQARAKDYGAAIQTFETLLRTYPDAKAVRPEAMYWLGDSYSKSGNHAAAKRVWERLNSEFPDSNWGKYARGRLSTDSEQPASPVKDAAKPFPAP
jgi:tetratricopeptide (TPR) repeat protein